MSNQYIVEEMEEKINQVAIELANDFNLNLIEIEFIISEHLYGKCSHDGKIQIKIQWPDGELVPEMENWRTLAHELAHLKHFNHNEEFWRFNKVLVERISELVGKKIRPEVAIFGRRVIS